MERAVIFGASRGLGAALACHLCTLGYPVVGWGRKQAALSAIRAKYPLFAYQIADFSKSEGQDQALSYLIEQNYDRVFCVVGGGPYGPYAERSWDAHSWAWQVTYVFAARVLHTLSAAHRFPQVVLVGSSIAESAPDPGAASYAAAKHALVGLYSSLRIEMPDWDIRLFSPGYMNTEMLPANAPVRKYGVYEPVGLAEELWTWSLSADIGGHRMYPKHPT